MLKNLAYTVPTLGRISIGEITVKNGKRIPQRLNHFKITAQHKKDGEWVMHPLHEKVATTMKVDKDKVTEIPVQLMFNTPSLNMRERYEAFDRNGRIICAGDGESARRSCKGAINTEPCTGPDHCEFGRENRCDVFARLNVQIEGQNDPLSSFILRTGSFNAVKTLREKLEMMHAYFGGRLVGVPLILKLRQKSSSMSMQSRFYYVDLVLNNVTLAEAAKLARDKEEEMKNDGIDQQAFEQAVMAGINNGGFEEGEENFEELEEFIIGREMSDKDLQLSDGGHDGQGDGESSATPDDLHTLTGGEEKGLNGLRKFLEQEGKEDVVIPLPTKDKSPAKNTSTQQQVPVDW
jgi:hypothetical protein